MLPVADGRSVIHAGELMPKDKALALMMAEFTPFGYTPLTVERFLERAFQATQEFLSRLAWAPEEQQQAQLAQALANDAQMAAQWRSKPPGEREAHAKKFREEEEAQERYWEELKEKHKRDAEEREKALQKQQAAWDKKVAFEMWQARNEQGGWKAEAGYRAESRRRADQAKWAIILRRIRERGGEE